MYAAFLGYGDFSDYYFHDPFHKTTIGPGTALKSVYDKKPDAHACVQTLRGTFGKTLVCPAFVHLDAYFAEHEAHGVFRCMENMRERKRELGVSSERSRLRICACSPC